MYLLPLVSTFLSSFLSGSVFGRFIGHRGSIVLSIFCLGIGFLSSILIWYEVVICSSEVFYNLFGTWFSVGSFNIYWNIYIDLTTAHMLLTVTSVSFAVHCYATVYIKSDPHLNLFMSYLSLFTFFMIVLVCSDNLIGMIVGWEGIQTQCLNGIQYMFIFQINRLRRQPSNLLGHVNSRFLPLVHKRIFYKSRIPANKRIGDHYSIFLQLLVGFMLGDGWLELHGKGARLGISLTEKFKDVAQFYKLIFYALGYVESFDLQNSSIRSKRPEMKPYYEIRTFSFSSLIQYHQDWYKKIQRKDGSFYN